MDLTSRVCLKIFIVLISIASSTEFKLAKCPLYSSVEEDAGCDICRCCRFASGEYHVFCRGNFIDVPPVPAATTYISFRSSERLLNFTRNSFPFLPNLTKLKLYQFAQSGLTPIGFASSDVFLNLPQLTSALLTINLRKVTSFLSSATNLRELDLHCAGSMTNEEFRILFHGARLQSLRTFDCEIDLGQRFPLKIPPEQLTYFPPTDSPGVGVIDLPGSDVQIQDNIYYFKTLTKCLNYSNVRANSLNLHCGTLGVLEPQMLDWMDRTDTNVSIVFYAGNTPLTFKLGSHKLQSLTIWFSALSVDKKDTFVKSLLRTLENAQVHRLVLGVSFATFPKFYFEADFLNRLIGPHLSELQLTGFPIGYIDKFNFNLTEFTCNECRLDCHNCTFSKRLRKLSIVGDDSVFIIDFEKFVLEHPNLEEIVLELSSFANHPSMSFPDHEKLRSLRLEGRTAPKPPVDKPKPLNVSGLIDLETLIINGFLLEPSNHSFGFATLKSLTSFDFSRNNVVVYGPARSISYGEIFMGLDSLKGLSLAGTCRNDFCKNLDNLREMLYPVSDTLEFLDLSQNTLAIVQLPPDMFIEMKKLERLDLSKNNIVALDGCIFTNNIRLSKLSLQENKLELIDQKSVKCLSEMAYLRNLDLQKNRLRCTCEMRALRDWMKMSTDIRSIYYDDECPDSGESARKRFREFKLNWIDCDFHKEGIALGSSAFGLLLIATAVYAIYYFRYDIMFWWVVKRRHKVNKQHSIHPTRRFHAFLSYSSSEQLIAEDIFFKLEEDDDVQFKIAYDCRDFLPIYTIADNIVRCIKASEKVIFLISRQFIEREWTTFELDYAQIRAYEERRNLIILIFVERFQSNQLPERLRVLCRNVNYLEYPDHADRRAVRNFWHRLRVALSEDSELEVERIADRARVEVSERGAINGTNAGGGVEDQEEEEMNSEHRSLIF